MSRNDRYEQEMRERRYPTNDIKRQYGLSESEMMRLFGSDRATQQRMIQERPELKRAVKDMSGLMSHF